MRLSEIIQENATAGATSAGAIATVAMPLGTGDVVRRSVYGENPPKTKKKKGNK